MSTGSVVLSVATSSVSGLALTALAPVAARAVIRAHIERRSPSPGRRRSSLPEIDDIFSPGRRHQFDHQVAMDTRRFDDWVGEGDPLSMFPDAYQLRGDLDPDGIGQARHEALERRRRDSS